MQGFARLVKVPGSQFGGFRVQGGSAGLMGFKAWVWCVRAERSQAHACEETETPQSHPDNDESGFKAICVLKSNIILTTTIEGFGLYVPSGQQGPASCFPNSLSQVSLWKLCCTACVEGIHFIRADQEAVVAFSAQPARKYCAQKKLE